MRARALAVLLLAAALAWAAPLAGLLAAGRPVGRYLAFPPRTSFVAHEHFAWSALGIVCLPAVAALVLYALALARARPKPPARRAGSFPWWGWLGLAVIAAAWPLAWSRGVAPFGWRRQSFTLLWLGYILVMNGLARRSTGRALLTHRSTWFLLLFPVSAAFWWLFEYLNQFVANWYYGGALPRGSWAYFLQATPPFSTVLPAVASTWAWLASGARLDALALPPVRPRTPMLAWIALGTGALSLAGIGVWPQALFAALWLAPLLLLAGLQQLVLGETLFAALAQGDWRPVLQPALAALWCGLFWELWNYGSLPKWHYSIPYVQRYPLFEMPLLGYAGYLPFGIECALVMDLVARALKHRGVWPLLGAPLPARSVTL